MTDKIIYIYNKFPIIRNVFERLAVRFYADIHFLFLRKLIVFKSYNNKLISPHRFLYFYAEAYLFYLLLETIILSGVKILF
jgi:hypothetical protein